MRTDSLWCNRRLNFTRSWIYRNLDIGGAVTIVPTKQGVRIQAVLELKILQLPRIRGIIIIASWKIRQTLIPRHPLSQYEINTASKRKAVDELVCVPAQQFLSLEFHMQQNIYLNSHGNSGQQLVAVVITFLVLASVAVSLRCYVRVRLTRCFGADDAHDALAGISLVRL